MNSTGRTHLVYPSVLSRDRLSGDHDDIMGFGWAAANANIAVLLQEGGGGGTLGKAMALHIAAVLPTHSAHLICLDDQYDESIYKAQRIPVVSGSSPVPRGPGLGCERTHLCVTKRQNMGDGAGGVASSPAACSLSSYRLALSRFALHR